MRRITGSVALAASAAIAAALFSVPASAATGDGETLDQPAATMHRTGEVASVDYGDVAHEPVERSEWTVQPGPEMAGLDAQSLVEDVIPVVAERIFEMGADAGFVRLETDYDTRAISVRWKDDPPAEVVEYIESRPLGVDVTLVVGATYSRAEAEAARDRLLNSQVSRDLQIVWADLNDDGSGVRVGILRSEGLTEEETERMVAAAGIVGIDVVLGAEPPRTFELTDN